jgi:hypothetical protein
MSTDTRSPLTRRSVLVVVIAAVLLVGIAAIALAGNRSPGPLAPTSETEVEFPIGVDQTATWGSPLPPNPTESEIVLRSIEPIGVSGLELMGIVMSRPVNSVGIINAPAFPPEGTTAEEVDGFVIPAAGGGEPQVDVLLGVRRETGASEGRIEGLRVRYVANGTEYEVDLPYGLHILSAPS